MVEVVAIPNRIEFMHKRNDTGVREIAALVAKTALTMWLGTIFALRTK